MMFAWALVISIACTHCFSYKPLSHAADLASSATRKGSIVLVKDGKSYNSTFGPVHEIQHYKEPGGGYIHSSASYDTHEQQDAQRSMSAWWGLTDHDIGGAFVFSSFGVLLCCVVPIIIQERRFYETHLNSDENTFKDFLTYRFLDWITSKKYAPGLVLLALTLTLIVFCGILYALVVGISPAHALWRVFAWTTAATGVDEMTVAGRILVVFVTVCGLIILSLLLGIVTDAFTRRMEEVRLGKYHVVEGDHYVIIGITDCTYCVLEELAIANESVGGGVFVLLSDVRSDQVLDDIRRADVNMRNSRIIARTGSSCHVADLQQVAAGAAKQIVLLADNNKSAEECDRISLCTLMALKSRGWPLRGRITVQCCIETSKQMFENFYGDKLNVVVQSDIVGNLMVQASMEPGILDVLSTLVGFEGNEFYIAEWPVLVGKSFREVFFMFWDAVPIGIFTAKGECMVNPKSDYCIEHGDRLIVIAEDDDSYKPCEEPYFNHKDFNQKEPFSARSNLELHSQSTNRESTNREVEVRRTLLIGWNDEIGSLLNSLATKVSAGSHADIYSPRPAKEREHLLHEFEQDGDLRFRDLKVKHIEVDDADFTQYQSLENLQHHEYDQIYVLGDADREGREGADNKSTLILVQLQHIGQVRGVTHFQPVVETHFPATADRLKMCGITNAVVSERMVATAIAAVVEEPCVQALLSDLFCMDEGNRVEIRALSDFFENCEDVPTRISFGQAAHWISVAGQIILFAWTVDSGHGREWIINPKDKQASRDWCSEDRVAVIFNIDAAADPTRSNLPQQPAAYSGSD